MWPLCTKVEIDDFVDGTMEDYKVDHHSLEEGIDLSLLDSSLKYCCFDRRILILCNLNLCHPS